MKFQTVQTALTGNKLLGVKRPFSEFVSDARYNQYRVLIWLTQAWPYSTYKFNTRLISHKMVNPGAFRGQRKEFLMAEKENYAAGMEGGFAADALAQIQRRYFKRFPLDLGHFEEPTPEYLASVDDNAPDPEPEEPDPEKLTPEAYLEAKKKADHRRETIRYRKAQIKRWLAYQYMKDQDLDPKESGASNPFHSLIFAITGKEAGRPRRRTAVNVWRKTQRESIEAKVKELAITQTITKDRLAALRDKVARDTFNNLSASEQEHWKQQAVIESDFALEEWKRTMVSEPPNAIKDYQLAIQGLVRISKPFLDFVCKATGWKASLIAGGPEPAQGGRLNVISIHSGSTPGDVKLNWGRAQRARFKKDVVPCFGDFLKMCYTPEECRARALPSSEGFEGIIEEECSEEGVDLDLIDSAGPTSKAMPTTASHSRPPLNSSSTPLGPCTSHNMPPNASRKAALYGIGRKGPPHQRVPPVRKNPSDIALSKRSANQTTASSQPVSSTTQLARLQASHGMSNVPSFYNAVLAQSSTPMFAASTPYVPPPSALCGASAAMPPGPAPSPSHPPVQSPSCSPVRSPSPTPVCSPSSAPVRSPSLTLMPFPFLVSAPPAPANQPPDTEANSPYQPKTTTSSSSDDTEDASKSRRGKKRERAWENSSEPAPDDDMVPWPRKKLRPRRNTAVASPSNAKTTSGPQAISSKNKAAQKGKSGKSGRSRATQESEREVGETQQAAETGVPKVPPPKRRRKSTGTWIVSDDEGGWLDQDGNPCEPPSNYKYL